MSQPFKATDYKEALAILTRALTDLLGTVADRGRAGSNVRLAIGQIIAKGTAAFITLAIDLLNCFKLAETAGASLTAMDAVRAGLMAEVPRSVLATQTQQLALRYCMSSESRLIAAIEFKSRDDVDAMLKTIGPVFTDAAVEAADEHDAASYAALIKLHAAVTRDLTSKARPLPRVIDYDVNISRPTLWLANRFYADAARSQELIDENKIIHPAFAPAIGRCLSN